MVDHVKPERDTNNRQSYRDNWWIHGEARGQFRPALIGLRRYIATVETSKHRFFVFLEASIFTVVLAYRRPAGETSLVALHPKMTASAGAPDFALLSDGDLGKSARLPIPPPGQSAWIGWEFDAPQTIRAITFATKDPNWIESLMGATVPERALESSDDGVTFHEITKLQSGGAAENTIAFSPVTARFFRVTFKHIPPPPPPAWAAGFDPESMGMPKQAPVTDYEIAELALVPGARVNHYEEKAAFVAVSDLYGFATPAVAKP